MIDTKLKVVIFYLFSGTFTCAKTFGRREFSKNTLSKNNPFDVTQTDPEEKDVTTTIVSNKGIENMGESKLTVTLKPKRPTTFILMFKAENAQSVDFKVGGSTAHVSIRKINF